MSEATKKREAGRKVCPFASRGDLRSPLEAQSAA